MRASVSSTVLLLLFFLRRKDSFQHHLLCLDVNRNRGEYCLVLMWYFEKMTIALERSGQIFMIKLLIYNVRMTCGSFSSAASGYGTQRIRLGKDAIKDFDCCCLSLQPCQDPVVTYVSFFIHTKCVFVQSLNHCVSIE